MDRGRRESSSRMPGVMVRYFIKSVEDYTAFDAEGPAGGGAVAAWHVTASVVYSG